MKTLIPILLLALAGSGLALAESVPKKKSGTATASKSKSSASGSSASGSGKSAASGSSKSKSGGTTGSKSGAASSSASSSSSSKPQGAGKGKPGGEGKSADPKNAPLEAVENVAEGPETGSPRLAAVSSVEPEEIEGFDSYAPQIQALIRKALGLTKLNLTYTFGSADPKRGGMDCSGTIYFLLHDFGFKGVPRSSDEMCGWVQDKTLLHRIQKADSLDHAELSALQPGNLIFWSGTYATAPRKIPVTHVMLYLGKLKKGGKPLVFGASDGRSYQGQRRTGVSVFDFTLPRSGGSAALYGYGLIPGVGKIEVTPAPVEVAKAETRAVMDQGPEAGSESESAAGEGESSSSGQRKAGGDGLDRSKSKAGAANQMTDGGAKAVKKAAEGKGGETDGADDALPATASSSSAMKPGGKAKAEADAAPDSSPAVEPKPKTTPESKPSQVSGSKPKLKSKSGETSTRKKSTGRRTGAGGSGTKRSGASPASSSSSSSSSSSGASQSPLSRARSAAGGFLEEVRRALPAGR